MCYKNEVHEKLEQNLAKQLHDMPKFISSYFSTLRSSRTKINNWGVIKNMLQYFIDVEVINKNSIQDIEPKDIEQITYTDIIDYLSKNKAAKDSTILNKKAVLSGFWTHLKTIGYVKKNIVQDIPKGKFKNEEAKRAVEIPTEQQLEDFISNIQTGNNNDFDCQRNLTIVRLFVGSGIRCEELIGLDIDDLYLDAPQPYIMVMGKDKQKVQDKVLLSEDATICLREYLEYRNAFIKEKEEEGKSVNLIPVFLSNRCERMSKTAIRNFFDRYSDNQIYPHMLRHLCGTNLYNATHNIMIVQHQLRHKDVATAAKYYIHVSDDDIYEAVWGL